MGENRKAFGLLFLPSGRRERAVACVILPSEQGTYTFRSDALTTTRSQRENSSQGWCFFTLSFYNALLPVSPTYALYQRLRRSAVRTAHPTRCRLFAVMT